MENPAMLYYLSDVLIQFKSLVTALSAISAFLLIIGFGIILLSEADGTIGNDTKNIANLIRKKYLKILVILAIVFNIIDVLIPDPMGIRGLLFGIINNFQWYNITVIKEYPILDIPITFLLYRRKNYGW